MKSQSCCLKIIKTIDKPLARFIRIKKERKQLSILEMREKIPLQML